MSAVFFNIQRERGKIDSFKSSEFFFESNFKPKTHTRGRGRKTPNEKQTLRKAEIEEEGEEEGLATGFKYQ